MSGTTTSTGHHAAPASSAAARALRLERAVEALLTHGTLSRTELAQVTGYSPASITATTRELIHLGLACETGQERSTGGRRRTRIQFERGNVFITLATIETTHLTVSQIDLAGAVQAQIRRAIDPEAPIAGLTDALGVLHSVAEASSRCVVVSLPGVVSAEGEVSLAPALGTAAQSVRLHEAIEQATGLPVLVENDVNLLALGEKAAGAAQDSDHFVLIYVGDGIGGALVLNGRVFRGATRSAGELGFLPWNRALPSADASVGPFEAQWSVSGLAQQAADCSLEVDAMDVLGSLAAMDHPAARALIEDAVEAWAYAAVINVCVLNPSRIVFAGEVDRLPRAVRTALRERVRRHAPSPVDLHFAALGEEAIAHGAIAQVINRPHLILDSDSASRSGAE